jgi:hypothetical protein
MGRGSDHRTVKSTTDYTYHGKQIHTNMASVDFEYLKTFGIRPIEGRDVDKAYKSDTSNDMLISETVAKEFKEKNLIGTVIGSDSSFKGWRIVGIFPDFHLYTMEEEIEPLSLTLDRKASLNYCFIKISSQNPVSTMEFVRKEMDKLEPGQDFTGSFVEDNISDWYQGEKMMSLLFSIAASVAVILSCSGLLAMVLLVIQQRVKEIGVRKVLGASVRTISFLISKDFLLLVFLAIFISTPIAWFTMSKWLQNFPYRIEIHLWMFLMVAVTALAISLMTIGINTVRAATANPVDSLRSE